ncbi:GGDEF domain-containing protein [Salmonella enterica]|nr:GGDEF domain-containing protein [Salmonella enterica]EDS5875538.1 GGDEF domain-containing protein [Salmonella enterica subsp. enterica serovar Agbeni]EAP1622815.1 GGDEF domain-containing protein [Salmonella enterica]EBL2000896.1 GGDEF domain-containing protein [Salmonella enterica]ECC5508515.1 GGDEF domain-containing protein [Salmonella enterica]
MTTPSWRSLRIKKYQFSLRLFLFLNAVSALFTLVFPLYQINVFCTPMIGIVVLSVLLLIWHGKYGQKRINLPFISLLFGGIWAAHIALKYPALGHYDFSFLLISLLSVLFIGSIAFAANIVAFTLYSLPPVAVCLWLNGNEQGLRLAERETLNGLSMLDPLTGLYNRRGLQNRLDTLQAPGSHEHYVLLLDIDHFKAYNDHYGHMMGDQALIRVSAAIRDAVRSRDVVCRFGGEEFLVLLTTAEPQQARATAERIRQEVYDLKIPHMFNESVATNVTVSIGIAPLTDRNIGDAIEKADKALYEAKHLGRNHILVSDDMRAL